MADKSYNSKEQSQIKIPRSKIGGRLIIISLVVFIILGLTSYFFGEKHPYVFVAFVLIGGLLFLIGFTVTIITNIIKAETLERKTVLITISSVGWLATFLPMPLWFSIPNFNDGLATILTIFGIVLLIISYNFPILKPKKVEKADWRKDFHSLGLAYIDNILAECSQLPFRDDQPYKWRSVGKNFRYILFPLGITILGLILMYIDLYTPTRFPFGWLIGLGVAIVFGLLFILGLLVSLFMVIIPTYICSDEDVFDVFTKILQLLKSGLDEAIVKVNELDDLSLQLILPSHRNRLVEFLKIIDEVVKSKGEQYQDVFYSGWSFWFPSSLKYNDNVLAMKVGSLSLSMSTEKDFASVKISVLAAKSDAGNWYLVLPDLNKPNRWIEYFSEAEAAEAAQKATQIIQDEASKLK